LPPPLASRCRTHTALERAASGQIEVHGEISS